VVLGHPVAQVAQALDVLRQLQAVAQRDPGVRPLGDRDEIEH
jgi:hypothetical protein